MKRLIIVSTLLTLLFTGCIFDGDNDEKYPEVNEFPLETGNTWVYRLSYDYHDSLGNHPDISMEVAVTWEITDHDSLNEHDAYEMEITHHYLSGDNKGKIESTRNWYEQRDGRLGSVASEGSLYMHHGQLFKMADTSDLYPWFVTIAEFPLSIGKTWTVGWETEISTLKTVMDRESVAVPAGNFPAYRVISQVTYNDIWGWYQNQQWFSSVGIVKMSVNEYINELGTSYGGANEKQVCTIQTTMELVEYHLK